LLSYLLIKYVGGSICLFIYYKITQEVQIKTDNKNTYTSTTIASDTKYDRKATVT